MNIQIALGVFLMKHTLQDPSSNLVPNKIEFPGNYYFQKYQILHFQ